MEEKNTAQRKQWLDTDNRYVVFLDILGFRDLVAANSHEYIRGKLDKLVRTIALVQDAKGADPAFEKDQVKVVTFSDSIMLFSKSDTEEDLRKIITDTHIIFRISLKEGLPMKGAISWGEITADFKKWLFFGKPIIDAYLLHEELHMVAIILDHQAETRSKTLYGQFNGHVFATEKVPMKSGKVTHCLLKACLDDVGQKDRDVFMRHLKKLYSSVSGKSRVYIDNTIELWNKVHSECPPQEFGIDLWPDSEA